MKVGHGAEISAEISVEASDRSRSGPGYALHPTPISVRRPRPVAWEEASAVRLSTSPGWGTLTATTCGLRRVPLSPASTSKKLSNFRRRLLVLCRAAY